MPIKEGGRFSPVQQLVSPGVFTRENDLTGLEQGVANIGGAVIAPFKDGPAFIPTQVTNLADLEDVFGVADGVFYGPYTAKEYLNLQGTVTIVRVGGLTGYWQKNPLVLYAEPGYWDRASDTAAFTTASFLYVDSDSYTSNLKLQLSSSALAYISTTGSAASFERATNSEISSFLSTIGWPSLSGSATLSASLAESSSLGKVLKVVTTRNQTDFSASVSDKGYTLNQGGSSDYQLAAFDFEKSRLSGSVNTSGSGDVLEFDTAVFAVTPGNVNVAPTPTEFYYNYLTASYTLSGQEITYGLVFATHTDNAQSFTTASYTGTGISSSVAYEHRFDVSRLEFSGSVNTKFGPKAATATYDSGYNGLGGSLSGSVLYADKQLNIGRVSSGILGRKFTTGYSEPATNYFYLTSSAQGTDTSAELFISTAIGESTETVSRLSSSILQGIDVAIDRDVFDYSGLTEPTINSSSFKAVRSNSVCGAGVRFLGYMNGAFGTYTGNFTSEDTSGDDPCNPVDSDRTKLVLGVLANTRNGSTQFNERYEVFGFKDSSISQLTSSLFPYSGEINPTEDRYQLVLKYNFDNDDGSNSSGTYGYYDFTLNGNDNLYIKNVFGTDPKVGDPNKQVAGQKVEAAYSYVLFEDSIKKFVAEKTRASTQGGGWQLKVDTAPSDGFSTGESMKYVDQYSLDPNSGDSAFSINNAYTPWVYSQQIAPFKGSASESPTSTKFKLFKAHTLSDGTNSNTKYKIEISNVKLAGTVPGSDYGSFTLSVRSYSDTDKRPKYLEVYQNLNLNPDSVNYVARRIGDRYSYITFAGKIIEFGDYTNASRYIRIEMNSDENWPETVVPYGFESYKSPVDSTLSTLLPAVRYSKASVYGLAAGKYPSGTVFNEVPGPDDEISSLYPTSSANVGVYNDTKEYFKALPLYGGNDQNGVNIDFDLEDKAYGTTNSNFYANATGSLLAPSLSGSIPSTYDAINESTYVKMRKFVLGFQGGFDGQWPAIPTNVGSNITAGNTQGLDCTNINSAGSIAYKQCIAAIGNPDEFDVNLIVLPGIFREQHSYVTDITIDMCEARGDCFYIMDNIVFPSSKQTSGLIQSALNTISTIDSDYVATYYPWVKILDTNTNKLVDVPPSVVIPATYAGNDSAAAEWYAPAGLNRGGIPNATKVLDRVTHTERDTLYEGRINPIASFPGQGIVAWGQKTLEVDQTKATSSINVKRLIINLKKFISSSSKYLVFENNVASTRNRFLSIVNPYMESVQQRNGLYAFDVVMDENNNTPDLIDRGIMYGQIKIRPTRSAEIIVLDFDIYSSGGASFSA